MKHYYLQHGEAGGPMATEEVEGKLSPMQHHLSGKSWTASGYGSQLPTEHMVKWLGRWRRVYCCCYSNVGALYIRSNGERVGVNIWEL